jgi:hypothetical protein
MMVRVAHLDEECASAIGAIFLDLCDGAVELLLGFFQMKKNGFVDS